MNYDLSVLYVEDEPILLEQLSKILKKFYTNVYTATNAKDALSILDKNDIDFLITDINMPEINGLELLKMIREHDKDLPILMLTAHSHKDYLLDSIRLKVDGYILKPIVLDEFVQEIKEISDNILVRQELLKNKQLLDEYKDAIDTSVIVSKTDPKGIITFVNEQFCNISGYTKEELIGSSHNIVRHPDNPSYMFKKLWETIKSNQTWEGIVKNVNKDGKSYFVKTIISPITDHKGNILEYISIRQDITELELYKEDIEKQLSLATQEIIETQKEVVYTIGAIGETRSQETGLHVKRVAKYSYLLAKLYGLSEDEATLLKQASPMHDIGKVGIPDSILNKPGKLTDEEFTIMKTHSTLGYDMLKRSDTSILKAAATIAHQHHEKWDGSGYPNQLKGDNIHIFGRITAIADVFDALGHDRIYKKAWPTNKILDLLKENRGTHFDPNLIDLFMDNLDKFLEIQKALKD